ncbi:hypothetical protein JCM3770_000771 [Rhodotorula araucariae]
MLRTVAKSLRTAPVRCARCASTAAPPPATPDAANTQTNQAEKQMRRFWKSVGLEARDDHYAVLLDQRTLKTPGGTQLLVPKERMPVALCIADEWENQTTVLKPHTLPMTSIAARALDGLKTDEMRKDVVAYLLRYLDTDTVCFHESFPERLTKLQDAHWKPLIEWVEKTYGVDIVLYEGILNTKQRDATILKLGSVVSSFDHFKLAAFERAVLASKSFLIALGLVDGHLSVEEAAKAAHVEVQSQIDRWGEVEDTHDVDHHDVRVRLGSAALLVAEQSHLE